MRRYAVLVGIDSYAAGDFRSLRYAVEDAIRMRVFLEGLPREERFQVTLIRDGSDSQVIMSALDLA
jgi:hypothetical protein